MKRSSVCIQLSNLFFVRTLPKNALNRHFAWRKREGKEIEKTATSRKKWTRLVTRRHANGHGSSTYSAWWNRDRLLKRGGKVRKREGNGGGSWKKRSARNSGRNASRRSARRREKERRRNKSGKNESIGGVFHDAPLEALQVGSAIGGVRLI